MGLDTKETTAAAALTEYATLSSTSVEIQPPKRKRAITPSGASRDLEKQPLSFDQQRLSAPGRAGTGQKEQGTVLYLAYGSNLAYKTFQGVRGVKPLRAVNVHVPDLELVFDLPAIAYAEPCMSNSRRRKQEKTDLDEKTGLLHDDGLNLGWSKGLVGVVYEVTAADYKHIIETEGGGMGYADVQVPCFLLPQGSKIVPDPDSYPEGQTPDRYIPEPDDLQTPFLAHTLLAPVHTGDSYSVRRPGWAQPSLRYLSLIRTGSREHGLPLEYIDWLESLQHFQATRIGQRIGGAIFLSTWTPLVMLFIKSGQLFADKNGLYPKWFATILQSLFNLVWWSYDTVFRPLAGEGERTIGT